MRIVQVLPSFVYGDAIGNDVIAKYRSLEAAGCETGIYAERVDDHIDRGALRLYKNFPALSEDDILLYHLSTASGLTQRIAETDARVYIEFHNVTPARYYRAYDIEQARLCDEGWSAVRFLSSKASRCIAVSAYNKRDLLRCGYECPIDVLPLELELSDFDRSPSAEVMERYSGDGYKNILFTGRIAPNKKIEDVIGAFCAYQRYYEPKSRLIFIGRDTAPQYNSALSKYVERLGVSDVIFTGHIPFEEIIAYYRLADCFLCMSEHEGFCVPLVEAMYMDVPIVAYDAAAVSDTLGSAGILYSGKKDFVEIAGLVDIAVNDEEVRNQLAAGRRLELERFDHDKIEADFLKAVGI